MIPVFVQSIIGSIVRWLLLMLFGSLIGKGVVTGEQVSELALWIAGGVAVLLWALWQKYRTKIAVQTALNLPAGATEAELKAELRGGGFKANLPLFLLAPALTLGALTQAACDKEKTLAQIGVETNIAIRTGANTLRDLHDAGKIADQPYVNLLVKVDRAQTAADRLNRALDSIAVVDDSSRANVLSEINALALALAEIAADAELVTDKKARDKIQSGVAWSRLALRSAAAVIASLPRPQSPKTILVKVEAR